MQELVMMSASVCCSYFPRAALVWKLQVSGTAKNTWQPLLKSHEKPGEKSIKL
jgi:hypothetical protein